MLLDQVERIVRILYVNALRRCRNQEPLTDIPNDLRIVCIDICSFEPRGEFG
jgi:hypothetical protein